MGSKSRSAAFILVLVVLMLIPHTRHVLVHQTSFIFGADMSTRPAHEAEERTEPRHRDDALVIARDRMTEGQSLADYWPMIERFPDEPALYANMLRYSVRFGPLVKTRSSATQDWTPLRDSPELRKVQQAIERGKELDPENAYFDLFEAVVLSSQGRDPDALEAIHRASGKRDFNDYSLDELEALLKARDERMPALLAWMTPSGKVAVLYQVTFPHYISFRNVARIAGEYIEQDMKQGRHDQAMSTTIDLINLGGLMRDRSEYAIGAMVGTAIQRNGVEAACRGLGGSKSDDLTGADQLIELRALVSGALSSDQWLALHGSMALSDEFRAKSRAYGEHFVGRFQPLYSSAALLGVASLALSLIIIFALVWVFVRLVPPSRGDTDLGPSRLSTWLLAIAPPILVLAMIAFVSERQRLAAGFEMGMYNGYLDSLLGAVLLLPPIAVILIAVARTRIAPNVGRSATFFARLRIGSAHALQALVVVYLLSMIAAIPITAQAHRSIEVLYRGEVRTIWEYQPPAE